MLLLTVYYIFSMIGMEAFGNAVKFQEFKENDISYDCLTNGKLADTDFAKYFLIS